MKKLFVILLSIPFIAATAFPEFRVLHVDTYTVDVAASKIEWYAEKVTGKHNGNVKIKSGSIANDHGKMSGKFIIDMTTIKNTDLPEDNRGKLEGHLKSDDFFGVDKFPEAIFEISSLAPLAGAKADGPNFNVKGMLTIKGTTNEITFPATIKFEGAKMTAKADVKIDRSKYNVRYGSKTFFADIGDKAIYDEFTMKLDLVMNK